MNFSAKIGPKQQVYSWEIRQDGISFCLRNLKEAIDFCVTGSKVLLSIWMLSDMKSVHSIEKER
jgi:tRNA A58 N-methylase Trm61